MNVKYSHPLQSEVFMFMNHTSKSKWLQYVLLPIAILVIIFIMVYLSINYIFNVQWTDGFDFGKNYGTIGDFFNGISTPILTFITALFALWAFLGQKEQLRQQKEDSDRQRIEGTFFQLLDNNTDIVKSLEFDDSHENRTYTGTAFFKKAYTDLINIYNAEEGPQELRLKQSMEKLDDLYKDIFHLYYKNLFQVFFWIYKHRRELSHEQIDTYVDLIRARLSHYQMTLIYFNAKFFGRNMFYKVLDEVGFLEKYNRDKFGTVEKQFDDAAKAFMERSKPKIVAPSDHKSVLFSHDELYQALQREELEVMYQPIVNSSNEAITAVEALLRWDHPSKGIIKPGDFINQMEDDFPSELFEYVLENVCKTLKQTNFPIVASVNVSANQLLLSDFMTNLKSICSKYKVRGESIQIEMTESRELYKREEVKTIIQSLQEIGIKIGIDDFGNGFFSFNDLMDMQLDFVKLDRQFVKNTEARPSQEQAVAHIINIIKLQNWHVTVEGIETAHQLSKWQELGVDALQGYFIGEEIPATQLKTLKKGVKRHG